MDGNTEQTVYLAMLVEEARQGSISKERLSKLDHILKNDVRAREEFLEFSYIDSALHRIFRDRSEMPYGSFGDVANETKMLNEALEGLAKDQLTAPVIEIQREKPKRELIQKVIYPPKERRKLSRFNIFMLINAAAVILFFLYLNFTPPQPYGVEVATLTDSMNAKWSDVENQIEVGNSFVTSSKSMLLLQGYAELLFDNQTKVTIEGPAQFQILTENQMKLLYGRLYAIVPQRAIGFTINTPSAQIIDLGTEFGIEADSRGDTLLHVMKGKTVLIAGEESKKVSMEVKLGVAKRVRAADQTISEISCDEGLFVRDIDSDSKIVWRGEKQIYLADIVSGGNGFDNNAKRTTGIDIKTGKVVNNANREKSRSEQGYGYVAVPDLPFVDGVFAPDCGNGPMTISSQGDTYSEFGDTSGDYYLPICSNDEVQVIYLASPVHSVLSLVGYDPKESSIICLHANAGITFDLNAIRSRIPVRIVQFHTAYGMSSHGSAKRASITSDFFVLVDGQPRMISRDTSEVNGTQRISIPLQEDDRFLTLACAEGQENYGDWSIFVNPILELE